MHKTLLRHAAITTVIILASAFWADRISAQGAQGQGCCADPWDPAKSERGRWGRGKMGPGHHQRMQRHWTFMHQDLPRQYQDISNPVLATSANLHAGATLYKQNCERCHGQDGMGDGEVANTLNPSPALLAYLVQRPIAVDGYLLWSVSEGGAQFGTDMPAFKGRLNRDEIWKIILYLRSGLPQLSKE